MSLLNNHWLFSANAKCRLQLDSGRGRKVRGDRNQVVDLENLSDVQRSLAKGNQSGD